MGVWEGEGVGVGDGGKGEGGHCFGGFFWGGREGGMARDWLADWFFGPAGLGFDVVD